jgi:hypothetical protein
MHPRESSVGSARREKVRDRQNRNSSAIGRGNPFQKTAGLPITKGERVPLYTTRYDVAMSRCGEVLTWRCARSGCQSRFSPSLPCLSLGAALRLNLRGATVGLSNRAFDLRQVQPEVLDVTQHWRPRRHPRPDRFAESCGFDGRRCGRRDSDKLGQSCETAQTRALTPGVFSC